MQGRALFKTDAFVGCKRDLPPPPPLQRKGWLQPFLCQSPLEIYILMRYSCLRHTFRFDEEWITRAEVPK